MRAKFSEGDKVKCTERCAKAIRFKGVASVRFTKTSRRGHIWYIVPSGWFTYDYRSYELKPATKFLWFWI